MPAKDLRLTHNQRPKTNKSHPSVRLVILTALLTMAIALLALTACGGESDDNTPAPISQPTSAPASTPPPATAEAAPATGSAAEEIFVLPRSYHTMELTLAAGDTVRVAYSAIGASTGGITRGSDVGGEREKQGPGSAKGEVIFTVLNPIEDQILNVDQMENNTAEFQADIDGKYQMVFTNRFLVHGLIVPVEYAINP